MLEAGCPLCGAVLPLTELGSHLLLHSHFACALCPLEGTANEVTLHAILSGHSATKLVCREQTLTTLLQQLQQRHFVFSKSGSSESTADATNNATNSRNMAPASIPTADEAETITTAYSETAAKMTPYLASETDINANKTPLKPIATSKAVSEQPTIKHPLTVEEDTSYSVIAEEEDDDLKPPIKKTKLTTDSQSADDNSTKSQTVECKKCELLLEKRPAILMTHIFTMKHDAFPPGQFHCLACDQSFPTADRFLSHRKNEHNGAALMKLNISLNQIISEIRASYSESHADRIGPIIISRLARLTDPTAREPSPIPAKSEREADSLDSSRDSTKSRPAEYEQGLNDSTERLVISEEMDVEDPARVGAIHDSPESRNECVKCCITALYPSQMVDHILTVGHGAFTDHWIQCSLCPATLRSRRSFSDHNNHHHNKEAVKLRNPLFNIDQVGQELETAFPNASSLTYSNALRLFENIKASDTKMPANAMISASEELMNRAAVDVEEDTSYSAVAEEEEDDLKPPAKKTKLISSTQLPDQDCPSTKDVPSTKDSTMLRQVECKKCQVSMDKRVTSMMGHVFSIKHDAFPPRQFQCLACGHSFQTLDGFLNHRKSEHDGIALMKMGVSLEQIMSELSCSYSEVHADRLRPLIISRLDKLTKLVQANSTEESHALNSSFESKKTRGIENEPELNNENEPTHRIVISEETNAEDAFRKETIFESWKSARRCAKCNGKALKPSQMLEHIMTAGHNAFADHWLKCSLCTATFRTRSGFINHNTHQHKKEAANLRNPRINIEQVKEELRISFPKAAPITLSDALRSFENVREAKANEMPPYARISTLLNNFTVDDETANPDNDEPDIALQLNSEHEVSYECSEEEPEIPDTIEQRNKSNIECPKADQDLLDLEPIIEKAAADLDGREGSVPDRNGQQNEKSKITCQEQEATQSEQNDAPKVRCNRCNSVYGLKNKAHLLEHVLSKSHGVFPSGLFACTACDKTFKFEYRHRNHAEKEHNGAAESRALVSGLAFLAELESAFPSIPWKEHSSLGALLNKLGD